MKYAHLLLRYGELFLKGRNLSFFERKLVRNIRKIIGVKEIRRIQRRLIVNYFPEHSVLKKVFGLVSYSPVVVVEKDLPKIKKAALEFLKERKGTFRIKTKRSDKTFPIKSLELNRLAGEYIEKKSALTFEFTHPDIVLHIEINQDAAYLFTEIMPCFGGLPVGVGGNVLLLIENEASILAGLLMMKRGCHVFPVAFEEKDVSLLQAYSPVELRMKIVSDYNALEEFAREKNLLVLVSGQKYENYENYDTNLIVFRPLIAYDGMRVEEGMKNFGG